jgi:hypothetical protein
MTIVANVFCFLSSLPLLAPATTILFGSYLSNYQHKVVIAAIQDFFLLPGGLLAAHPGMMYIFEPLQDLGAKIVR